MNGVAAGLMARQPTERALPDPGVTKGPALQRSMGVIHLTAVSIGATLGTGIFVILGTATPKAGPAIILAFVLAAITALFSALSYAELASAIPASGSAYSYTYASTGELFAWLCGWCLMLEYGVSVAAVAVGWGQYINELLDQAFGVQLPAALANPPGVDGGVVNLPALVIVLLATALLLRGTTESAAVNTAMVAIKVIILVLFCIVAFTAFRAGNLAPFAPLGIAGITAAAGQVFFSYIGFDAASTAGDEAKNPKRDLPRAIMLSLLITTVIYCLVALAAVGALPWQDIPEQAPLAAILTAITSSTWPSIVLSAGAAISIASVVLAVLYGQTRILYTMSRDGLVPKAFSKVGARSHVPYINIAVVGVVVAVVAGLVPLGQLAEATSIGALFAFALVNLAVIILRNTRPDLERGFRAPITITIPRAQGPLYIPVVPILGIVFCGILVRELAVVTWQAFGWWTLAGVLVYAFYGYRHSRLRSAPDLEDVR